MMKTEILMISEMSFVKTYSDTGMMIERDGVQYEEAIDPSNLNREYTETNIPIETETIDGIE